MLCLGVPFKLHPQPTSSSPILPRICVPSYAYAWEPNHHTSTPSTHKIPTQPLALCSTFCRTTPRFHLVLEDKHSFKFGVRFNKELGWRRLAAPKQEISIDLIHEFYANAILTEEEIEEAGGHTFRSYVRGKVVDFSPENLRNVMRFRAHVQGAATNFETRKEHDQQLDQVLADLCIPGATWKLSTGQLRVPIQLRRQELNPIARGWHEFSIHSLIPSSNRSEIPVIRAILIHCIMRGED
ncbi:hypothetical protein PIB30_100983, partial [Stylosanthes scabra]|nr:hypothetical protein [Stylosanthes scabra]